MSRSFPAAPVVDVAPLFGDDETACRATARDVVERFEHDGAIVAVGMPEAEEMDARAATMLRFFELDEADKLAVATRRNRPDSSHTYRGYVSTLEERRWAYNEMYDIGAERPFSLPPLRGVEMFAEPNLWPAREPAPGWRRAMLAYYGQLEHLGHAVLRALCDQLGVSQAQLDARFGEGNGTLRLLNYPLRPQGLELTESIPEELKADEERPQLVAGRHTDGCALSLLWQREAGLQAQAPDGRWQDIPRLPNSVSLHLGDVFEGLTGGRLRATPHRVVDGDGERRSIGFFVEPNLAASCAAFDGSGEVETRRGGDSYAALLLRRFSRYRGYEDYVPNPD